MSPPSFLFSAPSTPSPFSGLHLCPGCSPYLGCPPHGSHPGKQHRVMEKRAGPVSRQAAVDGNLTWPLPSSGTWSTYLHLPINGNGNTSLPGFPGGLNTRTSEKQSPMPGE